MRDAWFERAIFLSWYCSKADCKFCYMSLQKDKIRNPRLARRRTESVLAEALITKACGWRIEFLSGGYESYTRDELAALLEKINSIYGRVWLNIGVLSREELILYQPYIQGVCGAVETLNPGLHDHLCPSKPISEIEDMFSLCDELSIKKSMTIIIGLGETINDFPLLDDFIRRNRIQRITFYALNPHKGTTFDKGPEPGYYGEWISHARQTFPDLEIIAGSWVNRLPEISLLLNAGADAVTKFPAIKLFGTKYAEEIEQQVKAAGRTFAGTMTRCPEKEIENELGRLRFSRELNSGIREKVNQYMKRMRR